MCDKIISVMDIVSAKMTNTIVTVILVIILLLLLTIICYHYAKHRSKQKIIYALTMENNEF